MLAQAQTQNDRAFYDSDPIFDEAERYGVDVLDLCCRYQIDTAMCGIDLELHTYEALLVLVRGGSLAEAVACVDLRHPHAPKVVKELHRVAQRVADDRAQMTRHLS